MENYMRMEFMSLSQNEGLARSCAAAFAAQLNPTIEELSDIRTAVSEAVTNAIIHGYEQQGGTIIMECILEGNCFQTVITDAGVGIADIEKARQPFFTTRPELERSGMGFTVMEAFMDEVQIISAPGQGTKIAMAKRIGEEQAQ